MENPRKLYRVVWTRLNDEFVLRACEVLNDGSYGPNLKIKKMLPDMCDGVLVLEPPSVFLEGVMSNGIVAISRDTVTKVFTLLEKEMPALYRINGHELNAFMLFAPNLVSSMKWTSCISRNLPVQYFHIEVE